MTRSCWAAALKVAASMADVAAIESDYAAGKLNVGLGADEVFVAEHHLALKYANEGFSMFLFGAAGTGKTSTIKEIAAKACK